MTPSNRFNPQETPVCLSLLGIIVLSSLVALKKHRLFLAGIMHPVSIKKDKEYYRLVTSDAVHNDLVHLFINSFALFAVGSQLEEYLRAVKSFGSIWFLAIYITSCLCGNAVTFFKYQHDSNFSSAGASGSILGCMMSFMILQPYHIAFYVPVLGGIINLYAVLIYILFLIGYQLRSQNPLVNNEVHFYGAIGGIISGLVLK